MSKKLEFLINNSKFFAYAHFSTIKVSISKFPSFTSFQISSTE
jgi:hypothetical protein